MITTVTLNPCIDKTVYCENFGAGKLNRVRVGQLIPSGKGINSSVVINNLGRDTCCIGFNYTENGQVLEDFLSREGITFEFVPCEGLLRTNTKVFDEASSTMTELNEYGSPVGKEQLEALKGLIVKYAKISDVMILSGSVPRGVDEDIYGECCALIRANGSAKIIVDAEKGLLENTFKFEPDLIKPNNFELEQMTGCEVRTHEDIVREARVLLGRGVKRAAVSLGGEGAVMIDRDEAWFSPAVSVEVKGLQGAGDSMVAGMAISISDEASLSELLLAGAAAAAGSVGLPGTLLCGSEDFEAAKPKVQIEKLF